MAEMNPKAMYKISYGLFVCTAAQGNKKNGCIINTAMQVASEPNLISVAVNKDNLTHDMILDTGMCNVSVISQEADFELFKHFGFQTGREAIEFAHSNRIDAAFLDIELCGESGIETANSLTEIYSRINIIFLTGHSEYTRDALDMHCSGYILKPLTPEKIRKEIRHLRFPIRGLSV